MMERQTLNKNENLFAALLALSKITIDKTITQKNEGRLEAIHYQHLPVEKIDYLMEVYSYDWNNITYFDKYIWHNWDFSDFMKELKTLPEFEIAAQEVIAEFGVPEEAVKQIGLSALLRIIMKESANKMITNDNVNYYVELFIAGYESNRNSIPVVWNVQLWLGNIYIESDEIEIEAGVFLRRPTKEQLAEIRPKPNYINEFDKMTARGLVAGAILSFPVEVEKKSPLDVYPEQVIYQIEQWLNIFRLLKPTDLTVVYQFIDPVSIFEHPISENKVQPHDKFWQGKVSHEETSSYKLYLKTDEEKLLRLFVKNVRPALKDISHKNYLSGNSYDLAFHRYNDALLKSEVNAYKIISAMSSLEALLSDSQTDINFKIRLRVAKLLSLLGLDPLKVSEHVKYAYSLRSKLVHGSNPEKKLSEFARQHTHEIINYNRLCLLIVLQLKGLSDKEKLIKQIDNSFIDEASDIELKNLIETKVKIPIINPFPTHKD